MRFDAGIADHGQRIARGSAFRIVVDDDVDRRLRVGHSHAPALTLAPSLWPISLSLRRIAISSRLASGSARNSEIRSEEHTSELKSLMRISYAVFCLKKKRHQTDPNNSDP